MRRKALICSIAVVLIAAGSFALNAAGGSPARSLDVGRTAQAASVHYTIVVRLTKGRQPMTLQLFGGSSRNAVAVHLRLGALKLRDGTVLPGTNGLVLISKPFLYERAPGGVAVYGNVRWLRLPMLGLKPSSQTLSTVHGLTPAPLLRVVAESTLRPTGAPGRYAGTVSYDDPIVRTALHAVGDGTEFRGLRVSVLVGRDGLIHRIALTGRTADGSSTLALHARLFGFGRPVQVVPPKPGTFMDQSLSQLSL